MITNPENRGFAAAANQGVRAIDAEYYLLLNPDVYLRTNIDALIEAATQHGISAGKLMDATGKTQKGFTVRRFPKPISLWFELLGLNRLWPSNPVNRRYRYLDRDLEKEGPVEQPAGAFLMFRKDVRQRLGGFDETFDPIWFEDVDFCLRASQTLCEPYFQPKVAAEHEGGHSILRIGPGPKQVYWCASLLRYAAKHFRPVAYRGICLAVLLTSVPRAVAGMIRDRSISKAQARCSRNEVFRSCITILGFASRSLVSPQGARVGPERFS